MDIPVDVKVFLRKNVGNLYLQLGHLSEVFEVGFQFCQLPRIIRQNDLVGLESVANQYLFLPLDVYHLDHDYLTNYNLNKHHHQPTFHNHGYFACINAGI
jgi:hypothetical protein